MPPSIEAVPVDASTINAMAQTMSAQVNKIHKRIENAVSQAQLHCLSPLTFTHEVLLAIKQHMDGFAKHHSYQSFVSHILDLFQLKASFVFQPHKHTFNILLHVPLVKPEYLLSLNKYVPFPLLQDFSANHEHI